jgi:hypothetical protein
MRKQRRQYRCRQSDERIVPNVKATTWRSRRNSHFRKFAQIEKFTGALLLFFHALVMNASPH